MLIQFLLVVLENSLFIIINIAIDLLFLLLLILITLINNKSLNKLKKIIL